MSVDRAVLRSWDSWVIGDKSKLIVNTLKNKRHRLIYVFHRSGLAALSLYAGEIKRWKAMKTLYQLNTKRDSFQTGTTIRHDVMINATAISNLYLIQTTVMVSTLCISWGQHTQSEDTFDIRDMRPQHWLQSEQSLPPVVHTHVPYDNSIVRHT